MSCQTQNKPISLSFVTKQSQTLNPQISLPSLRPSQLHRLWRHGRRDLPSKVTTTATNPTRKTSNYLLPHRFSLCGSRWVDVIIALGCHTLQLAPRDLGEGLWRGWVGSNSLITVEQRNKGHLLSLGVTFVEFVPQATRRKVLNRCPFLPLLLPTLVVVTTEVLPVVVGFWVWCCLAIRD